MVGCIECPRPGTTPPIDAALGAGPPVRAGLRVVGRGGERITVEVAPLGHGMGQTLAAALRLRADAPAPVRRVDCTVSEMHVRGRAGWQRLVVDLWADDDAQAVAWLRAEAAGLGDALSEVRAMDDEVGDDAGRRHPPQGFAAGLLSQSIDVLELSVRTSNSLRARDLRSLGDLVRCTVSDVLALPNLGRRGLAEIEDALASRGLVLGAGVRPG